MEPVIEMWVLVTLPVLECYTILDSVLLCSYGHYTHNSLILANEEDVSPNRVSWQVHKFPFDENLTRIFICML